MECSPPTGKPRNEKTLHLHENWLLAKQGSLKRHVLPFLFDAYPALLSAASKTGNSMKRCKYIYIHIISITIYTKNGTPKKFYCFLCIFVVRGTIYIYMCIYVYINIYIYTYVRIKYSKWDLHEHARCPALSQLEAALWKRTWDGDDDDLVESPQGRRCTQGQYLPHPPSCTSACRDIGHA